MNQDKNIISSYCLSNESSLFRKHKKVKLVHFLFRNNKIFAKYCHIFFNSQLFSCTTGHNFPTNNFFFFVFAERPPFPCGKTSNTTMDCLGFADDKAVFYEASVDMCTLPAMVTLQVSQPDTDFLSAGTYYSDTKAPQKIGN